MFILFVCGGAVWAANVTMGEPGSPIPPPGLGRAQPLRRGMGKPGFPIPPPGRSAKPSQEVCLSRRGAARAAWTASEGGGQFGTRREHTARRQQARRGRPARRPLLAARDEALRVFPVQFLQQALLLRLLVARLAALLRIGLMGLGGAQPSHEAVNLPGGINDPLFARIERVAVGTDLDPQIAARRTDGPARAARRADDPVHMVLGMNTLFHQRAPRVEIRFFPAPA